MVAIAAAVVVGFRAVTLNRFNEVIAFRCVKVSDLNENEK
jgi:hypothetical protein